MLGRNGRRITFVAAAVLAGSSCANAQSDPATGDDAGGASMTTSSPTVADDPQTFWNNANIACHHAVFDVFYNAQYYEDPSIISLEYGTLSPAHQPLIDLFAAFVTTAYQRGVDEAVSLANGRINSMCWIPEISNDVLDARLGDEVYISREQLATIGMNPQLDANGEIDFGRDSNWVTPATSVPSAESDGPLSPPPHLSENWADDRAMPEPSGAPLFGSGSYAEATVGMTIDEFGLASFLDTLAVRRIDDGDCGLGETAVYWDSIGVVARIGPDGIVYGFSATSPVMTNHGLIDAPPIDVYGTGAGWGASPDDVSGIPGLTMVGEGTFVIRDDRGDVALLFGPGGLSSIRSGPFCHDGSEPTVGEY